MATISVFICFICVYLIFLFACVEQIACLLLLVLLLVFSKYYCYNFNHCTYIEGENCRPHVSSSVYVYGIKVSTCYYKLAVRKGDSFIHSDRATFQNARNPSERCEASTVSAAKDGVQTAN